MRPSEVLEQAHADSVRIRQSMDSIEARRRELRERIGVQGHAYERAPKNDIRDPMRHVCEAMDGEAVLDEAMNELKGQLSTALTEASLLIRGIRAYDSDQDFMVVTVSERLLRAYCIEGMHMNEVASMLYVNTASCERVYKELLARCDSIGMAKLKAAARGQSLPSDKKLGG